tara:strand:- start:84 stop:245 length:162 start_codon:yes stop_codon:yes gene_type:complete
MELESKNLKQDSKQKNLPATPLTKCCGSRLTNETGECCGTLKDQDNDATEITI